MFNWLKKKLGLTTEDNPPVDTTPDPTDEFPVFHRDIEVTQAAAYQQALQGIERAHQQGLSQLAIIPVEYRKSREDGLRQCFQADEIVWLVATLWPVSEFFNTIRVSMIQQTMTATIQPVD